MAEIENIELLNTEQVHVNDYDPSVKTQLSPEYETLNTKIKQAEDAIKELKSAKDETSINSIETIAIFASLFTFISVEFQIFKSELSIYSGVAFTLILLGALSLFLTAFEFFIKNVKLWFLSVIALVLIVTGVCVFSIGVVNNESTTSKTIQSVNSSKNQLQELISSSTKPYSDYINCVSKGISSYQCAVLQK